ncbi:SDR family NAD(P)-dependent oxidoreductase [Mycolicibacterium fortuitum]|uniref:SDR family NAD(P)-dependent oxidoreductase n=1 Tax=Mycolicibacterium fortuitum TaxID=1766 RepID=UPI001C127D79
MSRPLFRHSLTIHDRTIGQILLQPVNYATRADVWWERILAKEVSVVREETMSDLRGKRALVTGAARGIGAAIAVELATRGADVAITYQRSSDSAATVTDKIRSLGRRAAAFQADSADSAEVTWSIGETVSQIGGLDILVNNAGVLHSAPLAETTLEQIESPR